ncbi:hypothetical protein L208DRAFT_1374952 [Tricholoma matsutake]|nr:hypothetical protein L208DRAFT_1374952 [Tricholoma matsutake 945]
MVNGTVVDMIMQNIAHRVTLDKTQDQQFKVVTLTEKGYKESNILKKLLLLVHLQDQNHFVAVTVDFKEQSIGYGMGSSVEGFNYSHEINLKALSTFPLDEQINNAARDAYEQAENLWSLLKVLPASLTDNVFRLPSIWSWFVDVNVDACSGEEEVNSDYEDGVDDDCGVPPEESDGAKIQKALDELEGVALGSFAEEERLDCNSQAS